MTGIKCNKNEVHIDMVKTTSEITGTERTGVKDNVSKPNTDDSLSRKNGCIRYAPNV